MTIQSDYDKDFIDKALLIELLDTKFRKIRDTTILNPSILVWDVGVGEIYEVKILDLPARFPLPITDLKYYDTRWIHEDLGLVVQAKAAALRQSAASIEIRKNDCKTRPAMANVILIIPADSDLAYEWQTITFS